MEEHHVILISICVIFLLCESKAVIVLRWSATKLTSTLEARYNDGKWGEVCAEFGKANEFNDNAANVSCRQMGFLHGKVHPQKIQVNTSAIVLEEVVCPTGEESTLSECQIYPANASSKCLIAIRIECTKDPALDGLLNAGLRDRDTKAHEGILNVTKDGKEGDVCYDANTVDAVAKVVCKQMGYSGSIKQTPVNTSSSTNVYTAICPNGTEQTLAACTLSTATTCSSGKVINVQCKLDKDTQRRFDVRLSSPNKSRPTSEGTVEVYQYGRWGVVCDTDWDMKDAEVVCRELGYRSATSFQTAAKFGQGTGVVFWNKMQCNGNEPSIAECAKNVALGTQTCDSSKAAGVVCNNTEQLKTYDLCGNGNVTVAEDETFFFESDLNDYINGTSCVCKTGTTTTPVQFDVYVNAKIFQSNTEEALVLDADGYPVRTLHGEDSFAGPFKYNTTRFNIKFESNAGSGSGKLRIQVKASSKQTFTCSKTMLTTPPAPIGTSASGTPKSGGILGPTPHENNTGMIVGIVIAVAATIMIIILVFVLLKKGIICRKNQPRRNSSVCSYEKNIGGQGGGLDNKSGHNGGVDNKAFTTDTSNSAAKPHGSGVLPGSGDAKEPETGETERNTKLTRPASDSGIKVEIERASTGLNAYELEELPKGGVPMDNVPSSTKGLPPLTPKYTVRDQEYAVVYKPKNDMGGVPTVPLKLSQSGPTVPPKNFDGPRSLDVPGDNSEKDQSTEPPVTGVPEYNPYQDVEDDLNPPFNTPNSFVPGVSAAYADVELGAPGEASKIQDQPKQKEPMKKEKKKKHGKDKKKPEKEKKKIPRVRTGLIANEELPKGGVLTIHTYSPYELEGAPTNQASSPYELESPTLGSEEPVTKGVGPRHFIVSGPGNQEYAMVNKPMRMGTALPPLLPKDAVGNQEYAIVNKSRKGLPPLAPKYTVGDQEYAMVIKTKNDTGGVPLSGPTVPPKFSQSGPTVPLKNLDGPMSPDVPGDNLVKDQSTEPPVTGVPEYNPYQDVEEESNPPFNTPNTFMPVSAAYADVELGAPGEASKIQDQPKQKEPTKEEKNKKHGKDKKKPEKEKKKKWRKDKKKSKENLAEDAAHVPVGNDSCAVPMRDDFDKPPECEYAEVEARRGVGQINPAGQPEQF